MVIEKILGNIKDYPTEERKINPVGIEWFEIDKKLLRKKLNDEEDIGIRLDSSVHLKDGDVLFDDGKQVIVVTILPCELTVIPVLNMKQMGRLCFELGNRHLSLSIGEHEVRVPYDAPTFTYLEKIGFTPMKKTEKFTDFTVCHAHGHTHTHSHE